METIYKIQVSVVRQEETITEKQWMKGGDNTKDDAGEPAYGYTPQVKAVTSVSRTIYTQETPNFNLENCCA